MAEQIRRWHVYPDSREWRARVVRAIARAAAEAIAARGEFRIVLAGGATPKPVYAQLARGAHAWSAWRVYFGDERCLPLGDPQRNDTQARAAWLDRVPIPPERVVPIPAELGPDTAALRYAGLLAEIDRFDLVLLGLGEDGHTASLFPGHALGARAGDPQVLAVHDAPKPPPERVSLAAGRLLRSRQVFFLVTGASKRDAVAAWQRGHAIPAAAVAPEEGVDVLIEQAAMPD